MTAAGEHFAISTSVKAPLPQPTSSHFRFFGASTQSRNFSPASRLQRPISRS
jgi:hypothetical protein